MDPPTAAARRDRRFDRRDLALVAAILALVAVVRWVDLGRSPLWLDELWLHEIVARPSVAEVVRAAQAPDALPVPAPLALLAFHAAVRLFGDDARAARVPAYLAGLAALALTAWLAHRFFGRRVALLALLLMAASPFYAYYSEEAKQYGPDMAWTLATVAAFEALLARPSVPARRWTFALVALLAALSSYTMLFMFPALLVVSWAQRDRAARWWGAIASVAGGLLLAVLYQQLAAPKIAPVLTAFWQPFYPPGAGGMDTLAWLARQWVGLVDSFVDWRFGHLIGTGEVALAAVVTAIFLAGAWRLRARAARRFAAYLVVPAALLVLASLARRYPLGGRLVLFASPFFLIVVALGLARLADAIGRGPVTRRIGLAVAVAAALAPGAWLIGNPFGISAKTVAEPVFVMSAVRQAHPGDAVYLHDAMVPQLAWAWWPPGGALEEHATGYLTRDEYAAQWARVVADAPGGRFWLVHIRPFGRSAEITDLLAPSWKVVFDRDANGCRIVGLERRGD